LLSRGSTGKLIASLFPSPRPCFPPDPVSLPLDRFDHLLGPEELLGVDEEALLAQEGGRKLRKRSPNGLRGFDSIEPIEMTPEEEAN
jgi:hypothetical protein